MTNRSGLARRLAVCHLSYLICHFSYGNCLPAATPDPALFHFSPTGQFIHKYIPAETKSDHLFNDLVVCRDGDVFITDTGAVVGDTFYYITNSQIDHFQNGKVLHPETLAPIVVAKVELK